MSEVTFQRTKHYALVQTQTEIKTKRLVATESVIVRDAGTLAADYVPLELPKMVISQDGQLSFEPFSQRAFGVSHDATLLYNEIQLELSFLQGVLNLRFSRVM